MNNILIVSALDIETQGQLEDWKPHNLLITGVGKVNATYHLTKRLLVDKSINYDARINLVINYGTAGSRKIKKKTLVDCTKFIQRDMDVTGLGFMRGETPFEDNPPITIESKSNFNPIGRKATCGSGDNFVEDRSQYYGEVVDMEAYALAKVCYGYDVPFISFKYITDGADE
jgi:adenosylhomocysteine nucleosidase